MSGHGSAPSPLLAVEPGHSASVLASAGTGKTWLLVTRIVRLLLDGAAPESILAITFTRKAAAEMRYRVMQRLAALMDADDQALDALLRETGLAAAPETRGRARELYESFLFCETSIRISTFHAFCQELLQRFPLEADVPPGFELTEQTGILETSAWDALVAGATDSPDSDTALALELLFREVGGIGNTRKALFEFLKQRADWWSYTQGWRDPVGEAQSRLARELDIDPDGNPYAEFGTPARLDALREFADLLARHPTDTNLANRQTIHDALQVAADTRDFHERIEPVFLKKDRSPRSAKITKTLVGKLGEQGARQFTALHEQLAAACLEIRERLARHSSLVLSGAWYRAGQALVDEYQAIKRQQRVLDFSDLEWLTYRLLNTSGHAHWVQYKLDTRIDHLLIDEFQDTNPTQWRLVLPLLEEMTAGASERQRSVFLVGDEKQSIYRFRRADSGLLASAVGMLETRLAAPTVPLHASRRSASAIMECVNRVFAAPELSALYNEFPRHDTFLGDMYGRVELLPLVETGDSPGAADDTGLRNPLHAPRPGGAEHRHYVEGRIIGERIRALLDTGERIRDEQRVRPLTYNDVMILVRRRAPIRQIERALRDLRIPFIGADRGTLLESLEVRDLEALLQIMITPRDNLALAQVLRSPLFSASDDDLVSLARRGPGNWIEHLSACAKALDARHPLARADRLIGRWSALAGHVPVHDLLDRIFFEGNVVDRYLQAFPEPMQPRVRSNLVEFMQLALEVDSGRYPSLPHFLRRLQDLRAHAQDAPDAAPPDTPGLDRVRIMTVHGAKGLEAPVVFFADATGHGQRAGTYTALVDWPSQADRPSSFLLVGRTRDRDSHSDDLLRAHAKKDAREQANLLYVALTRPRQWLFVSGSAQDTSKPGDWYSVLRRQLSPDPAPAAAASVVLESGTRETASVTPPDAPRVSPVPDPRLREPIGDIAACTVISPSRAADTTQADGIDPDAGRRGTAIHRMLELICGQRDSDDTLLRERVARELGMHPDDPDIRNWWREASEVVADPALADLYDARKYIAAHNEIAVSYHRNGRVIAGVIDRLVIYPDSVCIIDYKTHVHADRENCRRLAEHYREQMAIYRESLQSAYADREVRASLLFTTCRALVIMN